MKSWHFRAWMIGGCLGLVLLGGTASAQPPNAWINFGQSYYKIPVAQDGIYRLTYAELQAAGIPVASVDPRRFNIFHRGLEQSILVTGQNDAVFDPSDVIEFYGRRNNGTLDADLYEPPAAQPHTFYNLYSDTTAYFLTWNPLPVPGKRMESFFEVNNLGLPVEAAHWGERKRVYTNEFSYVGDIQTTSFTQGEGWTGSTICTVSSGCTGQQDFVLDELIGLVGSSGTPELEVQVNGRSELFHNIEVYAGPNAGSMVLAGTLNFFKYETPTLTVPINTTAIGADGRMTVRVKITPSPNRDAVSVSYIRVKIPQDYDARGLDGRRFELFPKAGGKSYFEVQNPVPGSTVYDITDESNVRIIGTTPVAGGFGAVVDQASSGRTLLVNKATRSTTLKKVSFRSIAPSLHDYIIISHRSLMKPALGYGNAVQAYAAYRASAAGGGYDTLVVEMEQLYNQFNYGETSPRAIYQFMKFLDAGGDPRFLFLIGKGLEVTFGYHRKTVHAPGDFHDLVPSAGLPGADMAFTAGLNGTTYEPSIPTGRLTASDPAQVASYLNKVKEAEEIAFDALWRKDLLHLSGGIQPGEPQLFRQFVDGFKVIAEDIYLGAQVQTISKQTLNVELINVKDQVNKGLNLITFYGHSGPGTIDIDIGYVSDPTLGYQNAGKYPGFLINGCNAGRFFDNRVTFGEDWMLTANKGAKSFIAHSSFGFVSALRQYTELFYEVAFGDSTYIHKGIGEVQKETARRYLAAYGNSTQSVTQVQQMMLLGDPAVSLFGANKPDYEVSAGSVSVVPFDDSPVTAQSDSFAIEFRVRNFGRASIEPLHVRVQRTLGDGTILNYDSVFAPVHYAEVLRFIIRKGRDFAESGNNLFAVILDADNEINELSELNNRSTVSFFIPSNGTKNVFPPRYAIVSGTSAELAFQHSDVAAGPREFIVEIDTAATFGSPYLSRKTVSANGLGRLPVTLLSSDSLAYYWRTRLASPLPGESTEWSASSFTRIAGAPEGWAQLKFDQLNDNDTSGVTWNGITRRLDFVGTTSTVDVLTYGSANPNAPSGVSLKINGDEFNIATQGQQCRNNTLNLIAFDKHSSAPYAGIPFSLFDPRSCGREPQMIDSFTPGEMDQAINGMATFVANIKPSDSVVIFSIGDAGYASWTAGTKLALEQLGISDVQLSALQPGEPFVILSRKGSAPGSAAVFRSSAPPVNAQPLTVHASITGRYSQGAVSTDLIGPAMAWQDLSLKVSGLAAADSISVDVVGVTLQGLEVKLKVFQTGIQAINDIDPVQFPYLKLVFHTIDSIDLTPGQLDHWVVTYSPMAEGVLTYSGSRETEQVQEGAAWSAKYGFVNISTRSFSDSLTVRSDVFTRIGRRLDRQLFKILAPPPGDTTHFEVKVNTRDKAGINDVTVFVNPRVLPEPHFDNNVLPLYARLDVEADLTGPVLDVTIDGRHVVNGDAVSRTPVIAASVIDRNPFLLKSDTTGFDLFMQFPCADDFNCPFRRIDFTEPGVTWSPATATTPFRVEYRPVALEPGSYGMRIEASDAKGNASGDEPYAVQFVVSDADAFTVRSVYPNPSAETFHFRLFIGAQVPSDFQLEVYAAMGARVQQFGNESLPLLHVGTNDLTLAARDVAGNLLPAGVYLFRFTALIDGNTYTQQGRLVVIR